MLIYDTKTGEMRDMTEQEEQIANNMPDPEEQINESEIISILTGGAS